MRCQPKCLFDRDSDGGGDYIQRKDNKVKPNKQQTNKRQIYYEKVVQERHVNRRALNPFREVQVNFVKKPKAASLCPVTGVIFICLFYDVNES